MIYKLSIVLTDAYTMTKNDAKKLAKEKGKAFLQSWLETKEQIEIDQVNQARREKREAERKQREDKRMALERAKQAAAEAWRTMDSKERDWRLHLYEDMHYDHHAGMNYARRQDDIYGVWEYYLDHARELWKMYM
jgi:hypothetical protein